MKVYFRVLSFFELEKLIFGIEITMIVGTGKNSYRHWNRIIFDGGHALVAVGTDRGRCGDTGRFGYDRVDIFGSVRGNKVT